MSDYFSYSALSAGVTARVAPINTIFAALSAAFDMLPTEDQLKLGITQFGTDSGAANAYVVALTHTVASYTNGMVVTFVPDNTSTSTTVTLNVDSVGAKTVTLADGSSPAAGIIKANYFTTVRYNSTNDKWEIQGVVSGAAYDVSATIAAAIAAHLTAVATLTNKTIDGDDNTLQDIPYSAIKSTSRSGSDATLVTGTKGTSGDLAQWNADGDLVDGPTPPTGTIVGISDTQVLTNKTLTSPVVSTLLDVNGTADVSSTLDIGAGTTRRVAPAGTFVSNANGNPNVSDTTYDVEANLTNATWESFGPTGSGEDNIWTALDSVPTDADWIEIRLVASGLITGGAENTICECFVYARKNGSSEAAGLDNTLLADRSIIKSGGRCYFYNAITAKIPVDTGVLFDLRYSVGTYSTATIDSVLVGWGFNP